MLFPAAAISTLSALALAIAVNKPVSVIQFVVEPAPELEPSMVVEEPKPQPTIGEKFRNWFINIVRETEE